ncbi:MAG: DUF4153 domain-containing protein [Patescibacteria group bacterium]|jgi:hypothetical protein
MKHSALRIALFALFLGVVFDTLLYQAYVPGINIFLLQIAVCAVLYFLIRPTDVKLTKQILVAGIFSLLFAGTFAIWTSPIGLALSVIGLVCANALLILFVWGHHGIFQHPFSIIGDTLRYSIEVFLTHVNIFGDIRLPKMGTKGSAIVRGCLVALPILIIFSLLFVSSDLMLQIKTQNIQIWLSNVFGPYNIVAHLFFVVLFTLFFLIVLAATFWKRLNFSLPKITESHSRIESAVILLTSNALFLFFLVFQGYYLFGGQKAFASIENLTYSEYAVAGFNQLAVVATLVLLLILTLRHFHGSEIKMKLVSFTEFGLLVQTIALLISAWIRLQMYVGEYGFTPARLFGFWFFLSSALLAALLGVHIARSLSQAKFISQALVFMGCAMLIFTACAPDALTVRLNIARAEQTGKLDPFPLFDQLSAEAFPLMSTVLFSDQYPIGKLDAAITDYCPFVRAHYRDGYILNFTLIPEPLKDEALATDVYIRQEIADFQNRWLTQPVNKEGENKFHFRNADWRSWNLARVFLPTETQNPIITYGIPFPADQIANACGMYVGDPQTQPEE